MVDLRRTRTLPRLLVVIALAVFVQRQGVFADEGPLPAAVLEMREVIQAAAATGDIEALRGAIEYNELPPDFGAAVKGDPIAALRKLSFDGSGRDILAGIADILTLRPALIEDPTGNLYVWPYLAARPISTLSPADETALLRIAPPEAIARMRKAGRYLGWRLIISSSGVWHEFVRLE